MFKAFGQHAQRQDFGPRHRFRGGGAISENARQFRNFREPAAVFFAFVLDREIDVSPRIVEVIRPGFVLATQRRKSAAQQRPLWIENKWAQCKFLIGQGRYAINFKSYTDPIYPTPVVGTAKAVSIRTDE